MDYKFPGPGSKNVSWYWRGKNFSRWGSPRHLKHCCARRLVLSHGHKHGGAQKVLKQLYTLEQMRRTQQPTQTTLNTDLIVQAELSVWDLVDFPKTDPRYATSIHFASGQQ
jgi:hypothetical protein